MQRPRPNQARQATRARREISAGIISAKAANWTLRRWRVKRLVICSSSKPEYMDVKVRMALVDANHSIGSLRKRGRLETAEEELAVLERERLEVIIIG